MLGWSFIFFVFGNHHSFSKLLLSWMSNSLPSGRLWVQIKPWPGRATRVFNPLSPNIHIRILQTDLHTSPLTISWENLIKDQSIFSMVTILLILITLFLDNVWILLGETCRWSLLGLTGLKSGKIVLAKMITLSQFSWLCQFFSFFQRSKQDELFSCRSANSESLQISKIQIHFKDTMDLRPLK